MATPAKPSSEDRNVQIVLKAFDTLFNKRDYAAAERFWSPRYIQHSAHIPPGREGSSTWSSPCPRRCATRTTSQRRPVTSSFSTGGSAVTVCRRRGSSPTSYAWRMACSRSTGTSSRTRPRGSSRAAVCQCSATNFRLDANLETMTFHRCCFAIAPTTASSSRMIGSPVMNQHAGKNIPPSVGEDGRYRNAAQPQSSGGFR